MNNDVLLTVDSYKIGAHWNMLPKNTQRVYSYFEARKGARFKNIVFFGLQYLLKEYLSGQVVTKDEINEAESIVAAHLGDRSCFNREGWQYILEKHNGYLPIKIKTIPEGTVVPENNVLMTIENTDDNVPWLTNYLETLLSQIWSSCTVATYSREVKKVLKKYLNETSDSDVGLDFMLHDFGCRSVTSMESAAKDGAAHLVNFKGTDTVPALPFIMEYYNSNIDFYSIPASEHSIMTSLGQSGEQKIFSDLLEKYPNGLLSIVSDSYDIYNACEYILGEQLKDKVLNRNGTVVVRPDGGDPVQTSREVIEILGNNFGSKVNKKGYKVLNPKVRCIFGDGTDLEVVEKTLSHLKSYGWAAENIVFGMGSALLQKHDRDELRFAFKCSAMKRDGQWHDVYKKPIHGGKESKAGRLKLVKVQGSHGQVYETVGIDDPREDQLVEVFKNGVLTRQWDFDGIRERAAQKTAEEIYG